MIKAILFDLDDTLLWDEKSVKVAFQNTCYYAQEKTEVDPDLLEEHVRTAAKHLYSNYETFEFTKMIGINPFEGLWGDFNDNHEQFQKLKEIAPTYRNHAWITGLQRLGIDNQSLGEELAERFRTERKANPFVYEEIFAVLDQLYKSYTLILITNGSPELQNNKLQITPQITPYFKHIVISGAFGKGKPDPSIFSHALSTAGIKPHEAIMVGDNLLTDILGANRSGIRSVWVNRHHKPRNNDIVPDVEITHLNELFAALKNEE